MTQFNIDMVLENLRVEEGRERENLLVYPLFRDGDGQGGSLEYLLLEEALETGALKVSEVSNEGSVNTILVENLGEKPVLILDGEVLLGAKQNRIVNATILVQEMSKVDVPVSCVEQGRWRYETRDFDRPGAFGYSTLRRQKSQQVASNLEAGHFFAANQGAIWREINRKQERMRVRTETDSLHDVYHRLEEDLHRLVRELEPMPGQSGIMVFINNSFACLDLFDGPVPLGKMWRKLLQSYAMEALEALQDWEAQKRKGETPRAPDPAEITGALKGCAVKTYPSVGAGTDFRLRGTGLTGAGLALEDRVLHLSLFGSDEGDRDRDDMGRGRYTRMSRPSRRRDL